MSNENEEDKQSNTQKRGGALEEVARGAPAYRQPRGERAAVPFRKVKDPLVQGYATDFTCFHMSMTRLCF